MLNKKQLPFAIAAGVILLALSFYLGRLSVSKNSSVKNFNPSSFAAGQGRMDGTGSGARMQAGAQQRNNMASGEITSKDEQSLTLKLADGGSKIVYFSDKTSIGQTTLAESGDLAIGQDVIINGTANNDGSLIAQMIQIRNDELNGAGPAGFMPGEDGANLNGQAPVKAE
ncbi:MAG: DUF5666 domain-containing protein [Patescibacteria group bacterium]|nr:DUF5666 domain-containing protein [Patescibacteria group bacterium]